MKKRGALKDRLAGIAHGIGYTVIPNWRLDAQCFGLEVLKDGEVALPTIPAL